MTKMGGWRRRRTPVVVVIVLAVLGVGLGAAAFYAHQAKTPATAPTVPEAGRPLSSVPTNGLGTPLAISIPDIDVSSEVNTVWREEDGSIELPAPGPSYDEAAWFGRSALPGTDGSAVIIGRNDSAEYGPPSIFTNLPRLRAGQRIEVTIAGGGVVVFVVEKVQAFPPASVDAQVDAPALGRPELRLVTCGSTFDDSAGIERDGTTVSAGLAGFR